MTELTLGSYGLRLPTGTQIHTLNAEEYLESLQASIELKLEDLLQTHWLRQFSLAQTAQQKLYRSLL
ncbi:MULTISPECIES: hypothetical protein [unclassified Pseudomonas]|uniref:hypothetical protein n=1 Tax=unclassified Pseudomonas TaxID=196821 RepID=UPI002449C447|nr:MULTISPECIES: hypothetical protein [unclassified Pseudomonas]MDG9931035.1 hypothetical protein [Pseudomonas sp. GD04042]MDH0485530.1 hypothetical protein [Pseudomonas sp. GD04015]MDH0606676.1 hypothetical protein [Pseudomonas sp. GD03869]